MAPETRARRAKRLASRKDRDVTLVEDSVPSMTMRTEEPNQFEMPDTRNEEQVRFPRLLPDLLEQPHYLTRFALAVFWVLSGLVRLLVMGARATWGTARRSGPRRILLLMVLFGGAALLVIAWAYRTVLLYHLCRNMHFSCNLCSDLFNPWPPSSQLTAERLGSAARTQANLGPKEGVLNTRRLPWFKGLF